MQSGTAQVPAVHRKADFRAVGRGADGAGLVVNAGNIAYNIAYNIVYAYNIERRFENGFSIEEAALGPPNGKLAKKGKRVVVSVQHAMCGADQVVGT